MRRTTARFFVLLAIGWVVSGCSNGAGARADIRREMDVLVSELAVPFSIVVDGENCGWFSSPSCVDLFALATSDFGTSTDDEAICRMAASLPDVQPVDPGPVVGDVRCRYEACRDGYLAMSDVFAEQPEGEPETLTLRIALSVGCSRD